jgi:HlyD family secretion protein
MTATAAIVVEEIKDGLLVGNAALRFSPLSPEAERQDVGLLSKLLPRMPRFRAPTKTAAGPGRTVWVLRGGEPVAVPVVVGSSDGKRTQILKGDIAPGEAVITGMSKSKS